jgi:hypothetical protein
MQMQGKGRVMTEGNMEPRLRLVKPHQNPDQGCGAQPTIDGRIRLGQEAWARLRRQHAFPDWLIVGEALAIGQGRAAHVTGATTGYTFNREMGRWLRLYGFDAIDKGTRSRLLDCIKHCDRITAWLETLSDAKRARLNHPTVVWSNWQRTLTPRPARPAADPNILARALESAGLDAVLAAMPAGWREQLEARVTRQDDALALQRTSAKALTKSFVKVIKFAAKGDVSSIISTAKQIANRVEVEGRELKDIAVVFHRTGARRSGLH